MPDDSWIQTQTVQALINDLVSTIVSRYRIDEAAAKDAVESVFKKREDLRKVVGQETSPARIMRTRAFKDAVATIKRNVYYDLRRYSTDSETQSTLITQLSNMNGAPREDIEHLALRVAETHASTRERLNDRDDFYRQLLSFINCPKTILDVGSGMHPLLFPFDALGDGLDLYVAADKDPVSIAAVNAYAKARGDERLVAINWDIRDGWTPLIESCQVSDFNVAFLFKLIPVVERQKPELLNVLIETPAKVWVLTGSKVSMTKRHGIERRERAVLRRFYDIADRRVVHEFSVTEEFGLVLGEK
jgi:16S rRNA (guanine(1405)-N(7))-methyltransferase